MCVHLCKISVSPHEKTLSHSKSMNFQLVKSIMLRQLFIIRFSQNEATIDLSINKKSALKLNMQIVTGKQLSWSNVAKNIQNEPSIFCTRWMQRFLAFSERKKIIVLKFCLDFFFKAKINFKPSQRDFKTVLKHLLLKFGHCYSSMNATEMQGKIQSCDIIYRFLYNYCPVFLIRK